MRELFKRDIAIEPPDGAQGQKERGAFYTPDLLAGAICWSLRHELDIVPRSIFEPGCGGGAFLRAARAVWPDARLHGVDLVPACDEPGVVEKRDVFKVAVPPAAFGERHYGLVLGNPDFTIAERVVRHCMTMLPEGAPLALLLLSSFEESKERIEFWREFPLFARQAVGFPRPAFRADGQSDMRPYATFVWRKGIRLKRYLGLAPLVWK